MKLRSLVETKPALELAVVDRDTDITHDAAETWFGSTKTIRMHATYRVKAGFDLSKKLEVNVAGQDVNIKVPKATILSVEPLSPLRLTSFGMASGIKLSRRTSIAS